MINRKVEPSKDLSVTDEECDQTIEALTARVDSSLRESQMLVESDATSLEKVDMRYRALEEESDQLRKEFRERLSAAEQAEREKRELVAQLQQALSVGHNKGGSGGAHHTHLEQLEREIKRLQRELDRNKGEKIIFRDYAPVIREANREVWARNKQLEAALKEAITKEGAEKLLKQNRVYKERSEKYKERADQAIPIFQKNEYLTVENEQLLEENKRLVKQAAERLNELERLKRESEWQLQEVNKLKEEQKEEHKEYVILKERVEVIEAEKAKVEREKARAEGETEALKAKVAYLGKKQKAEIEAEQAEILKLKQDREAILQQAEEQVKLSNDQLVKKDGVIEDLQKENAEKARQLELERAEKNKLKAEVDNNIKTRSKDAQSVAKKVVGLGNELTEVKAILEKKEGQVKTLEQTVQQKNQELEKLNQEMRARQNEQATTQEKEIETMQLEFRKKIEQAVLQIEGLKRSLKQTELSHQKALHSALLDKEDELVAIYQEKLQAALDALNAKMQAQIVAKDHEAAKAGEQSEQEKLRVLAQFEAAERAREKEKEDLLAAQAKFNEEERLRQEALNKALQAERAQIITLNGAIEQVVFEAKERDLERQQEIQTLHAAHLAHLETVQVEAERKQAAELVAQKAKMEAQFQAMLDAKLQGQEKLHGKLKDEAVAAMRQALEEKNKATLGKIVQEQERERQDQHQQIEEVRRIAQAAQARAHELENDPELKRAERLKLELKEANRLRAEVEAKLAVTLAEQGRMDEMDLSKEVIDNAVGHMAFRQAGMKKDQQNLAHENKGLKSEVKRLTEAAENANKHRKRMEEKRQEEQARHAREEQVLIERRQREEQKAQAMLAQVKKAFAQAEQEKEERIRVEREAEAGKIQKLERELEQEKALRAEQEKALQEAAIKGLQVPVQVEEQKALQEQVEKLQAELLALKAAVPAEETEEQKAEKLASDKAFLDFLGQELEVPQHDIVSKREAQAERVRVPVGADGKPIPQEPEKSEDQKNNKPEEVQKTFVPLQFDKDEKKLDLDELLASLSELGAGLDLKQPLPSPLMEQQTTAEEVDKNSDELRKIRYFLEKSGDVSDDELRDQFADSHRLGLITRFLGSYIKDSPMLKRRILELIQQIDLVHSIDKSIVQLELEEMRANDDVLFARVKALKDITFYGAGTKVNDQLTDAQFISADYQERPQSVPVGLRVYEHVSFRPQSEYQLRDHEWSDQGESENEGGAASEEASQGFRKIIVLRNTNKKMKSQDSVSFSSSDLSPIEKDLMTASVDNDQTSLDAMMSNEEEIAVVSLGGDSASSESSDQSQGQTSVIDTHQGDDELSDNSSQVETVKDKSQLEADLDSSLSEAKEDNLSIRSKMYGVCRKVFSPVLKGTAKLFAHSRSNSPDLSGSHSPSRLSENVTSKQEIVTKSLDLNFVKDLEKHYVNNHSVIHNPDFQGQDAFLDKLPDLFEKDFIGTCEQYVEDDNHQASKIKTVDKTNVLSELSELKRHAAEKNVTHYKMKLNGVAQGEEQMFTYWVKDGYDSGRNERRKPGDADFGLKPGLTTLIRGINTLCEIGHSIFDLTKVSRKTRLSLGGKFYSLLEIAYTYIHFLSLTVTQSIKLDLEEADKNEIIKAIKLCEAKGSNSSSDNVSKLENKI